MLHSLSEVLKLVLHSLSEGGGIKLVLHSLAEGGGIILVLHSIAEGEMCSKNMYFCGLVKMLTIRDSETLIIDAIKLYKYIYIYTTTFID